jgi:TolB-like protein/tetratricopeptide (TPR) repeat protein
MASLMSGYEYDIFISYRQNDNRSGWVTEFVSALQEELAATLKESVSVYFDTNPHDGLLETHNVDKSLEGKLKCLIFIPVISQTYCDTNSFAWQHEFVAFNKMAKEDQYGRDIRLTSGNVASRILPVKIHDLDAEDKALLENELGGVLRSIEFIYKASGVNRPLKPNDERTENLNHTYYRDQINKVANAVKEIISAIKKHNKQDEVISKEEIKPKTEISKNLKPKIIVGSFFVLALLVLGYFFIPKLFNSSKPVDKSIAVLPFKSLSDDPEKQYLADGMMDAILLHLSKIEDLRVMSRTSVEQYRKTDKASNVIGQELGVAYLLEGSFQKYGDNARLIVQLIKTGKEGHVWAKDYDRNWNDVFSVQSEVAQTIARELHAVITPEEKQLIERTPTVNLTAYDFYQRGREELVKYWINGNNREALEQAEYHYRKALEYDSTFAKAYTGMAIIYWSKHYYEEYFSKNFLDSVLILANIALSYDNQLSEAYIVRGQYYNEIGNSDESLKEFDKAIQLNPNDWMAYMSRGALYSNNDLVKSLENYHKAISLNRDSKLPVLFRNISWVYSGAGFREKAEYYNKEALKLDRDSLSFYETLSFIEETNGNYTKALDLNKRVYALDTSRVEILWKIGNIYVFLEKYDEALDWFKKFLKHPEYLGYVSIIGYNRIGLAFWKNGFKDEARFYFNKHVNLLTRVDELGRTTSDPFSNAYDIAGVYAFLGEKEKAYEKLRLASKRQTQGLYVAIYVKNDALVESYKFDPIFQQYFRDVESKYQAEHERVRKWLEKNGML